MKNLIFCAYAKLENMSTSQNIHWDNDKDIYLKNLSVALVSAKINNPAAAVALITNTDIPSRYSMLLTRHEILILKKEFDSFNYGSNIRWGLAFYKLCAMKFALTLDYDNYLSLDTDTYCQSSLDDLWVETKYNIMLYDTNHRLTIENCRKFNKEVYDFLGKEEPITKYGGEFIAGNKELLTKFNQRCEEIFELTVQKQFYTTCGDEFITDIVANEMKTVIKNAGGYIFRFWTGPFYLVTTSYKYNEISILHVPDEKNRGMIKLYKYLEKNNKLCSKNKVHRILNIKSPNLRTKLSGIYGKFKHK